MLKPNLFYLSPEEREEKRKEISQKIERIKLWPILKKMTGFWLYVLFMVFSLITTIQLALYLWP